VIWKDRTSSLAQKVQGFSFGGAVDQVTGSPRPSEAREFAHDGSPGSGSLLFAALRGVRAIEWWAAELKKRGIRLGLARVMPEVRDLLEGIDSHLAYTMWDPEPGRSAWNSLRDAGGAA
jgi:hypothetical protein